MSNSGTKGKEPIPADTSEGEETVGLKKFFAVATCILCRDNGRKTEYAFAGGTGTLWRHLKKMHLKAYESPKGTELLSRVLVRGQLDDAGLDGGPPRSTPHVGIK